MDASADQTPPTIQPSQDDWTFVSRRRRPVHFLPSSLSPPKQAKIYNPHSPTYAQVLRKPATTGLSPTNVPPHLPQPVSPTPKYVRPPNSPTNLPYPPNPYQKEWWGRCFRCAQKGHVVAQCTYPRMLGSAPNPEQASRRPTPLTTLRPSALPLTPAHQPRLTIFKSNIPEPSFDELLAEPEPSHPPHLPSDRLETAVCYFHRDRHYFDSLQNSLKGIVVQPPPTLIGELSLDKVAELLASSSKVSPCQLQAAWLSGDRILIMLPPSLNRDEVISAIPRKVWDDGFTFHSYSPHIDAAISIPSFKVWIDLCGVPLQFCSEMHLARVVSSFGTYLGSMEPKKLGDIQNWSLFIATDSLALIPHKLEIRAGGLVNTVSVHPKKWIQNPVYHRIDLPPMMVSFQPPPPIEPPLQTQQTTPPGDSIWLQDDDVMPMSLKLLREFFKDVPRSHLPADLAACLDGDREAIKANQAAYCSSEHCSRRSTPIRPPPPRTTQTSAAPDPEPLASKMPNPTSHANQQPTPSPPAPPAPPALTEGPLPATATVHRTERLENRRGHVLPDLSLEVCSQVSHLDRLDTNGNNWDPHLLFPELRTTSNQTGNDAFIAHRTNPTKGHKATRNVPPPHPLRRTTRGRINKKTNTQPGFDNLDAADFVDVPLQYAEGRQLLNLIGAENVPIPPILMEQAPTAGPTNGPPSSSGPTNGPPPSSGPTNGPPSSTGPSSQGQAFAPPRPFSLDAVHLTATHDNGLPNPPNPLCHPSMSGPLTPLHDVQQNDIDEDDPYLDNVDYSEEDYDVAG